MERHVWPALPPVQCDVCDGWTPGFLLVDKEVIELPLSKARPRCNCEHTRTECEAMSRLFSPSRVTCLERFWEAARRRGLQVVYLQECW